MPRASQLSWGGFVIGCENLASVSLTLALCHSFPPACSADDQFRGVPMTAKTAPVRRRPTLPGASPRNWGRPCPVPPREGLRDVRKEPGELLVVAIAQSLVDI